MHHFNMMTRKAPNVDDRIRFERFGGLAAPYTLEESLKKHGGPASFPCDHPGLRWCGSDSAALWRDNRDIVHRCRSHDEMDCHC
jgi:hypothetical protein